MFKINIELYPNLPKSYRNYGYALIESKDTTQSLDEQLLYQFKNVLNKDQQDIILNLSNFNNDTQDDDAGIDLKGVYHTNCVGTSDSADHESGLFPNIARINHSCLPNAFWIYEDNIMTVRALFDIKKGQEITSCYLKPLKYTFQLCD